MFGFQTFDELSFVIPGGKFAAATISVNVLIESCAIVEYKLADIGYFHFRT